MITKFVLAKAASFTVFVFSFLGGFYIIVNSWVHPQTLPLQLTHLAPWPREDTFGIVSLLVSFGAFFIWNLLRYSEKK